MSFRDAVGDIGLELPSFAGAWEKLSNIVSGVAAVIANQLGHLTGGFVRLFSGDFSGAWESFRNLGVGGLLSGEIANAFTRGSTPEPEEVDEEAIETPAKVVGSTTVRGVVDGVNEELESLEPSEREVFNNLFGGASEGEERELITFDPDDVEVIDEADFEREEEENERTMDAANTLDAFEEDIADRKLEREARVTQGLRTLFADNVENLKSYSNSRGSFSCR